MQSSWQHPTEQGNHRRRHIGWHADEKPEQILQGWQGAPGRRVEPKGVEILATAADSEETKGLAVTNKLGQRREEVRILDTPSNFRYPKGKVTKEWEGFCVGSESRRSDAAQLARKAESFELMSIRKNLVKGLPLKDTTNVEVSKVPDRNEGRGVAPCTVFDGQRLNSGLDVFEEVVEMGCVSAVCSEGKIF